MFFFIMGVLVGWLAEWLFFTFFVKGKEQSGNNANTSALQTELNSKNKEIKALQAKLSDASSSSGSGTATASSTTSSTSTGTTSATVNKSAQSATSKTTTAKGRTAAKSATTPASSKASTKTATKTAAKKAAPKKPAAKSTATKKSATKATTTKSTAAKKPATASKATPKKAVAKKKPATTKTTAKTKGDDFTRLSGIGPSMAANLIDLGIDTYKKLAAMDDDILRDMLEASGARLNNNKEAMDSWNEQATLADKGDFAGLKKLQEALKK